MERIAITGAAGYIGSRVCYELKKKYELVPIDNFYRGTIKEIDGIEVIDADIRNKKMMDELLTVDAVIHLAAISGVDECAADPHLAYNVNVIGTKNIGLICKKESIPLIFPSSVAVFGDPAYFPLDENHPRMPLNWYGKTKNFACEALKLISDNSFPVYEYIVSNVVGIHTLDNKVISRPNVISIFLDFAKRNKKIPVYKPGTQARNFLHVKDVTQSFFLGLKSILEKEPMYRKYCIAGNESITIIELAEIIMEIAKKKGYNPEIACVKNPRNEILVDRFDMNICRAKTEIKFAPCLTILHEIEEAFNKPE